MMFTNRNRTNKKIYILACTFLLVFAIVLAPIYDNVNASLYSSFEIIKDQYPEFYNQLQAGGAGDSDIEAFLVALSQETSQRGPLTNDNFDSVLLDSLEVLLLSSAHSNVRAALVDQFATEVIHTYLNRTVHSNLQPLRNSVKDSVLDANTTQPSVPSGSSGGSIVVPPTSPTPISEAEALANVVKEQIAKGMTTVELKFESDNKAAVLAKNIIKQLKDSKTSIAVVFPVATFVLDSDSLDLQAEDGISLLASNATQADSQKALSFAQQRNVVGNVVKLTGLTDSKQSLTFSKPISVTISYAGTNLAGINEDLLDVFYFNEISQAWEKRNGTINKQDKTVTFETKHFSLYAIMEDNSNKETDASPIAISEPGAPTPVPSIPNVTLSDIGSHWAKVNIETLVSIGAINGYPDGTFMPNDNIRRAEFATVLVNALKLKLPPTVQGKVFADTSSHWAKDAIAIAAYYGIVTGYEDNTFRPNEFITREQMALMIMRAKGLQPKSGSKSFTDQPQISSWAKESVEIVTAHGLMGGYPDGSFKPKGNATRAEAVTVIVNSL